MGFMAGFGPAFARSYDDAKQRSAQREDDILRYTYDMYSKRQDKWDEYQREDAKLVKAAKNIAEQSGKGEGVWPKVYEWLSTGTSLDDARRLATKGTFDVNASAQPDQVGNSGNTNPDNTGVQTANPAAAEQTQQAFGMVQPVAAAQRTQQADTGGHTGILRSFFGKKFSDKMSPPGGGSTRAVQQIADMTGQTPEQIQRVMTATYTPDVPDTSGIKFTPPADDGSFPTQAEAQYNLDQAIKSGDQAKIDLYKGIVKAHQETVSSAERAKNPQGTKLAIVPKDDGTVEAVNVTQRDDGTWETRDHRTFDNPDILSDHDLEARDKLVAGSKEASDLKDRQAKAMTVIGDAQDLVDYAKDNPDALTHVGELAQYFNNFSADAQAIINVLDDGDTSKIPPNAYDILKREESSIDSQLKDAHDLGTMSALFNAKATLMTYEMGMVMGNGGRSFTKDDYNKVYDSIIARDPVTFNKKVKKFVSGLTSDLDNEAKQFNDYNAGLQDFERLHGKGSAPDEATIKTMKDLTAQSPDGRVKKWMTESDSKAQKVIESSKTDQQEAPPQMVEKLHQVLMDPKLSPQEKQRAMEAFSKKWKLPQEQPVQ